MLREIEYFATLASIHSKDYKYPKKDLDDMWENVLLYLPPGILANEDVNSMTYCPEVQLKWSMTMQERYPPPRFTRNNIDLYKNIQYRTTVAQRGVECLGIQRQSHSSERKTPNRNQHTPLA